MGKNARVHTALSKKVMATENLNSSIIIRHEPHQKRYLHSHAGVKKDNKRCFNTVQPTMDKLTEFVEQNNKLINRDFVQIHNNMTYQGLEFLKYITPSDKIKKLCTN
jgi:hypothetical protein